MNLAQQSWILPLGRLFLAALFIMSGIGKVMGFEGSAGFAASAGMPFPELSIIAAIVIELGAGILLIVGWKTRLGCVSSYCLHRDGNTLLPPQPG